MNEAAVPEMRRQELILGHTGFKPTNRHPRGVGNTESALTRHLMPPSLSFLNRQTRLTTAFPVPQGCHPTEAQEMTAKEKVYVQTPYNPQNIRGARGFLLPL